MASNVYSLPSIYELAFSYRNIRNEVLFLKDVYLQFGPSDKTLERVLEIAAGNGAHSIEFVKEGVTSVGILDSDGEMMRAAESRFHEVPANVEYLCADMRNFNTEHSYDLAICMLDSLSHLTTDDDLVSHLGSVKQSLGDKGLYIIELAWPSLDGDGRTSDRWSIDGQKVSLDVIWGEDTKILNDQDKIFSVPVNITVLPKNGDPKTSITDEYVAREWALADFTSAVERSGGWKIIQVFGDFDMTIQYDPSSKMGWRMIVALMSV